MHYAAAGTHRLMIRDSTRTEAFFRAITAAVRPGDVVLDVGSGSGILSLFAARAGARRVYAVERTPIACLARELVRLNGFEHVVRVMEAPIEAASLPGRVDVLVSEWLGSIGVDENLLGPVLLARDCWLTPGGRIVPLRVAAWMAPARTPMRPDIDYFRDCPYGLDLRPLGEESVHELLCYRRRVNAADLVAPARPMWNTDTSLVAFEDALLPARTTLEFVVPRRATVNSLIAWFSAELVDGVHLTNAPDAPDTHWGQLLLPLRREQVTDAGDVIAARVTCIPAGQERTHFAWSVRVGRGRWEHHDTRPSGFTRRLPCAGTAPP